MRQMLLLIIISCFAFGCGQPKPYRVKKNLAYGNLPDQTFDFYEPPYSNGSARPLIIAIHGGAWQSGDKVWGKNLAEELCWRGYTVASINYRLAPEHPWPAQYEDCVAALQYFRTATWMKTNRENIAAFGHSAGGHLAAMLALRDNDNRVRIAISASGEGDLINLRDQDENLHALFGNNTPTQEQLVDVSPITFARQDVSLLMIHAVGDTNVIYDHSLMLQQRLLQLNADAQLYTLFNGNHNRSYEEGIDTAISFLNARGLRPRSNREKEFYRFQDTVERKVD